MNRDESYLAWAAGGALVFSTCTRAQYMAIIVDIYGRVIGTGYNGAPPGHPHCADGHCPHADEPPLIYEQPCIAIHAEANALLWSDRSARVGGTLYVSGVPCYDCAKKIAGSGIARVVFRRGARDHVGSLAGIALMRSCGLTVDELDA